ncbi:MAG TPA: APC family permease [Candidatus Dormibacteraeota bacterium]|nr:APC family permease [Candidatus Dormibacteraeota bacterium]
MKRPLSLFGRPLRSNEAAKEEISPVEGLSALSLDALTSVAYGPQALLVALGAGGLAALKVAPWITLAIVGLLVLLVASYTQVIAAYPSGGGAYAVARANLGARLTLLAGAALIVDYVLTVAVSIAAGVGSLTSAFPGLVPLTVPLCLVILAVVTFLNLRGLAEGARAFLLPTLAFIAAILIVIAVGLIHPLAPHLKAPGVSLVATHGLEAVGILLLLQAFSAGCSALTGVEAIANGVPLFRRPQVAKARQTEVMLGVLLATMLLGLGVLVQRFHVEPRTNDAVLNQIIGYALGRGWAFAAISVLVTLALALAANTSFGGLPVLASLLAKDHRLPHAFGIRGDRLVFTQGIWALALLAGILLIATQGNTDSLIPLYAIGVFTGFTLAQSGMVRHWLAGRPKGWWWRITINGVGAITTGVATVIFVLTKFREGGWVVVVAIPLLIWLFLRVSTYYREVAAELHLGQRPARPKRGSTTVVVPFTELSLLTSHALSQALSMGERVVAVTVVFDEEKGRQAELEAEWRRWDPGVPLVVLSSPYRSVARPLLRYISSLKPSASHRVVVLIPVVLPRHFWHRLLHNHLDLVLTAALQRRAHVVVARLPMRLRRE